jgi:hypothetical protein
MLSILILFIQGALGEGLQNKKVEVMKDVKSGGNNGGSTE